ncbi:MAG: hypothetical protein GY729_13605 [Desulfobacteraceae bacterium]|nr:hypothetical protein [Desulfobacteraceae bacterium]
MKTANKLLGIIIPKIAQVQGTLPSGTFDQKNGMVTAKPSSILRHAAGKQKEKISDVCHWILCWLLLISGIISIGYLLHHSPYILVITGLIFLITFLMSLVAVVRQIGSTLDLRIKIISITALACSILYSAAGYAEYFFFIIKDVGKWSKIAHNQWETLKFFAQINPFDYPIILSLDIFFIVTFFILGLAGMGFLWKQEK